MPKVIVTGGSGFVGREAALAFLDARHEVVIFDVEKPSVDRLVACWHGPLDLADGAIASEYWKAHADAELVLHCAGQTAVTASMERPMHDFSGNVLTTACMLESLRLANSKALVVVMSSNKVYGPLLGTTPLAADKTRWSPISAADLVGFDERVPADPETFYGTSKRCAELYCLEYARTFNIKTCILRCSCIYGETQRGSFDQGWIAHVVRSAVRGDPVVVCGSGLQVRDCLHVDDLAALFSTLASRADRVRPGSIYNVGGGPANTMSVVELLGWLTTHGFTPKTSHTMMRPSDQRWYVSDLASIHRDTRWAPTIPLWMGLKLLLDNAISDDAGPPGIPVLLP